MIFYAKVVTDKFKTTNIDVDANDFWDAVKKINNIVKNGLIIGVFFKSLGEINEA